MLIKSRGLSVIGSSLSLPASSLLNEEIWPSSAEWVEETLGIRSRRHISSEEKLIDLCIESAQNAILAAKLKPTEIDCIIVATSTPDFINPSMAAIIHGAVGASIECPAFDIQAVCAGFIYGMGILASLAENSGSGNYLLIGADQFSKITDFDKRDSVFFGDAAAAMVIKKSKSESLFAAEIYADGKNWTDFHTPNLTEKFEMNSKAVGSMASEVLPKAVKDLCSKLSIDVSDISHFFTHQPSKVVLDKVEVNLGLKEGKIHRNLLNRANTASASIPSVFYDSAQMSKIKSGDLVCFAAIGAGWVWGVAIMEWRI